MTLKSLFNLLKTKTLIHSSITLPATIINGLLGMGFYLFLARILGPGEFGIVTLAIVTLTLLCDIGNFGSDTGLIRFIGKFKSEPEKIQKVLKLTLEVKFIMWVGISLIGFCLLPTIVNSLISKPYLLVPLSLSLVGVGGGLFFSFVTNSLQALEKFWFWSLMNIAANSSRLALLLAVYFLVGLTPINSLIIYILIPFVFFMIGLLLLPSFLKVKNEFSLKDELLSYNKWIALFTLMAALASRLDLFLTAKLLPASDLGIYGLASQMTAFFPQLIYALAAVAAPKLSSMVTKEQALGYLKKLQLLTIGIALLAILGLPLILLTLSYVFAQSYQASLLPFTILFISNLVFLLSIPTHQAVFYFFAYPKLFSYLSLINLLIILIGGYFLISSLGIVGAALSVLIGNIVNLLIPLVWVIAKFKQK